MKKILASGFYPVLLIAKKEIMDNIRNFWIVLVTAIFILLTLTVSYFGSLGSTGWNDLGLTVIMMESQVRFLIPILALMLGYAAVVGEIERGSMDLLLSLPVRREEIVIGKYMGLSATLAIPTLLGFGCAGIVIGVMVGEMNYLEYIIFILSSILFGMVYLSISFFLSTIFKRRSTAIGGAIFLWFFFSMILPMIVVGIGIMGGAFSNGIENTPSWYLALSLVNPSSAYSALIDLNLKPVSPAAAQMSGFSFDYPPFYTSELMVSILLAWVVTFVCLSLIVFKRRDI